MLPYPDIEQDLLRNGYEDVYGGYMSEQKVSKISAQMGREFRSITCVSEGTGPNGSSVPSGHQQARRCDGEGHLAGEAVQPLDAGSIQATGPVSVSTNRCSVCERHAPAGEPDAGKPHVRFGGQGVETDLWEPD